MTTIRPVTKYNDITNEINAILERSTVYIDSSSFEARRLRRECDNLSKVDPAHGWICRARLEQLQGNEDEFRHAVRNAERLDRTGEWSQTLGVGLLNLHRYSEAQTVILNNLTPELGLFGSLYPFALNCGAYCAVDRNYRSLPEKGMPVPDTYPHEMISRIASYMAESDITDQDVSSFLDVAGDVLRRHSYMLASSSPHPSIVAMECESYLHFRYSLDLPPAQIASLNVELAEMMAEHDSPLMDKLHVSFGVNA